MRSFRLFRTLVPVLLLVLAFGNGLYAGGPLLPAEAAPHARVSSPVVSLATWIISLVDSSGNVGEYASLALDAAGLAHLSYHDRDSGSLKYARQNGPMWFIETVESGGITGMYTSIVLDSMGWPHISYFDYSDRALHYARWNGMSWQVQTVDTGLGSTGGYTSLALDSSERAHISYYNGSSGDLKYAYWDGSAWQIQTVSSAGMVGEYNSLALGAGDLPRISYYDATNNALKYAAYDGSAWQIQTVDLSGQWTSLALDSLGNPHISYYDADNADAKYAYWDGSAWQIQTVESADMAGEYTSLALEPGGLPRVSYYDASAGELRLASSNGVAWQIEAVDAGGQWGDLALDGTGQPHLGYYDALSGTLQYAFACNSVDAASVTGPTSLGSGEVGIYSAAASPPTATLPITFVWSNGANGPTAAYSWTMPGVYTVTVYASNACGTAGGSMTVTVCPGDTSLWVVDTVDSQGNVGAYSSLGLDSAGRPHISYFDGGNYWLKYAWHDGASWHIEVVDNSGEEGMYTSLALDVQDRPHISYYASWPALDLKYAWKDLSGWQIETVDSTGDVGFYSSLALDADGWPHISYYDSTNHDLKYAWKDAGGWHTQLVDGTGDDVGSFTALALDAAGLPHISYLASLSGDLKYAWYDGSAWHTEVVAAAIGQTTGSYTSLALDSSGRPHIGYYDVSLGVLRYAYYDGAQWVIETKDGNGDTGRYTSLALDSAGQPNLSYYLSWPSHDLKYAHSGACSWLTRIVDGPGDVGLYTSLALDAWDNARISYYDAGNGDLRYAFVCVPLDYLWITGPTDLGVGETGIYTASYLPITATESISLLWNNGTTGPTAAYSWTMPGIYTVSVVATTPCSQVEATWTVEVCQGVDQVTIAGPTLVLVRETWPYTATYSPPNATPPVTLLWDNGSISPTTAYSWTVPGIYTLLVTATNSCGQAVGSLDVEVCQSIEDIAIDGPAVLPISGTGIFTASALPLTSTQPVSFTWDNGTVGATAAYSWTAPGLYTITVTGTNACGQALVVWSVPVCTVVERADVTGPIDLLVGQNGAYNGSYAPITATQPVTLTWNNGTTGPSATYSWPQPGVYSVTATAANFCSQATAGLSVNVCQPLTALVVGGPTTLAPGQIGTYTTTYSPGNASLPVTISWSNGMTGPSATYSWSMPGTYQVSATATNACGQAQGSITVEVQSTAFNVYLPLIVKKW